MDVTINLFGPLVFILLFFFCIMVINLIYNIIDRNIQDNLIKKLIERLGVGNTALDYEELKKHYPLVSEDFMQKTPEEQRIINNQDIQKLKKKTEELEQKYKELKSSYNQLLERVEKKLSD